MGIIVTRVKPSGQIKASPPIGFRNSSSWTIESESDPWHLANLPNAARYWRFEMFSADRVINELAMFYDGQVNLLTPFTMTNLGTAFIGARPLSNITNGNIDGLNAFGQVVQEGGNSFDVYVDFGNGNDKDVTKYALAPGRSGTGAIIATPTSFNAYKSSNAVDWTLVKNVTGISGSFSSPVLVEFDITP